jgi:hypothetical protein
MVLAVGSHRVRTTRVALRHTWTPDERQLSGKGRDSRRPHRGRCRRWAERDLRQRTAMPSALATNGAAGKNVMSVTPCPINAIASLAFAAGTLLRSPPRFPWMGTAGCDAVDHASLSDKRSGTGDHHWGRPLDVQRRGTSAA